MRAEYNGSMTESFRIVHEANDAFGYIGHLCRDGSHVWAVGGTYGKATVLLSSDGGVFEAKTKPPTNGLRDLVLSGDRTIACGEQGGVFISSDRAATWTVRKLDTSVCLFTLHRDAKGDVWI